MDVSDLIYLPQAKWKEGERLAFGTSASMKAGRVAPLFKIVPAGGYDPKLKRVLTTTEYLRSFGAQLAESCGRRTAFIDAELIDDERHTSAVGIHPLTELLIRARLAGANAAPVFSLTSSPGYLDAVKTHLVRHPQSLSCFRLGLQEIDTIRSAEVLTEWANRVGAEPNKILLLIDGGPIAVTEIEELTHLLASQISRLVAPGNWLKVFWSSTAYPDKPKLGAGQVGAYPRLDWKLYESIINHSSEFPVKLGYSDYMLEYPSNYRPVNVRPTAKLSYSTKDLYLISKGKSTKVGDGYKNIFPVAANLFARTDFLGASFCSGDAYIQRLATATGKTGGASQWRWCSADHHLALVDLQLRELFGLPSESPAQLELHEQMELL